MDAVPDDRVAVAIIFPTRIEETDGVLVACCTTESSIAQRRHTRRDDGSISPSWLLYQCYFYAGMSLLNWGAMTDPLHSVSSQRHGLLGDYFIQHRLRRTVF